MPLPLIIGAAIASGLYGAYKGVKGASDHSDASNINTSAKAIVNIAQSEVNSQREITNSTLVDYGSRKLRAFNGVISEFLDSFGRLKNVEFAKNSELDRLNLGDFTTQTLQGLRQDYQALKDAGLGVGAGLGSGAALAFGAYNGTMLLASASTGTAIASLSGAAATNATLAWLGGGSLAAGGYGMAGGMVVLGGIVAGPALAIFGHIVANKAEEALNNARGNLEQANTIKAEAHKIKAELTAIERVTSLANSTFSTVSTQLRRTVKEMNKIMQASGENFNDFNSEDRAVVFQSVKLAQLIKALIDTPILDTDGKLVISTEKRVIDIVGNIS